MSAPWVESSETDIPRENQLCLVTECRWVEEWQEQQSWWGGGGSLTLAVSSVFISADQSDWSEENPQINDRGAGPLLSYWLLSFS